MRFANSLNTDLAAAPNEIGASSTLRETTLCVALFGLGFYGYALTMLATFLAAAPSRAGTVPHRGLLLVVSIVCFAGGLVGRNRAYLGRALLMIAAFWLLYTAAIFREWENTQLRATTQDYLLFAWGVCFLPMLGFFRRFSDRALRSAFVAVLITAFCSGALMLRLVAGMIGTTFGRYGDSRPIGQSFDFDPLHLAYLGSSSILLSLYTIIDRRFTWSIRCLLSAVLLTIGSLLLLVGSGRGAVVAVGITAIFVVAARTRNVKELPSLLSAIAILAGLGFVSYTFGEDVVGSNLVSRFTVLFDRELVSIAGSREAIYSETLSAILDAPLLGAGLAVPSTGSYPHNYFLESFLATGIIGGTMFFGFTLTAVVAAWRLLRSFHQTGWIAVLFVHYLVAAQVSSGLVTDSSFWFASAAVIAAWYSGRDVVSPGGDTASSTFSAVASTSFLETMMSAPQGNRRDSRH